MSSKVWFITGASRGFGRIWAEAALKRGDKVTATARKLEDIADLKNRFGEAVLPLALDVTDSEQVPQVVQQAFKHFDRQAVSGAPGQPGKGRSGGDCRSRAEACGYERSAAATRTG
jgi:NAD(P)-dependent dehydrogenase (short-subunit alcohol dehydrogenase family)